MTATEGKIALAVVGVGKIARDQHLPSIERTGPFRLDAAVSRNASVDGARNFPDIEAMLEACPDIAAVALCMPPQVRYEAARAALAAGRHVLLEKPPGATIAEVDALARLADEKGLTLFATWHSRFAPAVAPAKAWLSGKTIDRAEIVWKEDVRRWHPGQDWIWQPGGLGVFDPGINALSILTEILPAPVRVTAATLEFAQGRDAPIAAKIAFADAAGAPVEADFDWRQEGPQTWDIRVEADGRLMVLSGGGAVMALDGETVSEAPVAEYDRIYERFADLVRTGKSDVDLAPLVHVADAFMLGKRVVTAPFTE